MINIFNFTDYRKYLSEYYIARKKAKPSFSYQFIANKAGFKDRGFLHSVIGGKKNLSKPSIIKISRAIGHNKNESDYFENLVFLNQAIDLQERNYFYEKLASIRSNQGNLSKIQQLRKDQFELYSKWYHGAIRSIIDMYPFKDDYKWLAKKVFPSITPKQAKKSIQLLEQLGLIKRNKDRTFQVTNKNITTGDEVTNLALQNYHKATAELAADSISQLPKDKRNISGLTIGISQETYEQICTQIKEFRAKIVKIVDMDNKSDMVYRLTFQLFPLSSNKKIKGEE